MSARSPAAPPHLRHRFAMPEPPSVSVKQALARLRAKGGMSTNAADSRLSTYPDAAQRERLHAVAAPRKSPSTSSYVSIDNTLPTDVVSPVIPHPSGILARWMARPAGLFFPPTRLEEVWRWVLARALAVCGAALARLRALPPMMIMMNDVGCASVRTHPGGAIRSTREAGICDLSKLAEGS